MKKTQLLWVLPIALVLNGQIPGSDEPKPDKNRSDQLDAAKKRVVANQEYSLQYKFAPQETIRWKVTHIATTETTIQGNTQTSKSSSVSTKAWRVKDIDDQRNVTFSHVIESVEMWQAVGGRQEVRYNSQSNEAPPAEYEAVAKTVGQPLSTITINPSGKVVRRDGDKKSAYFGLGDIATPLPDGRVTVGAQWHVPSELTVRADKDGRVQKVKTRQLYTLEKVQTGVATIEVKTEVLTPINDPKIQSQIMQQLTEGTIKFDIDAGRILSKQIDWNEDVVAFHGPESKMKYLARFTEELLPAASSTARKPGNK